MIDSAGQHPNNANFQNQFGGYLDGWTVPAQPMGQPNWNFGNFGTMARTEQMLGEILAELKDLKKGLVDSDWGKECAICKKRSRFGDTMPYGSRHDGTYVCGECLDEHLGGALDKVKKIE